MIRKLELVLDLILPLVLITVLFKVDMTYIKITAGLYLVTYLLQYYVKVRFYSRTFNLKTHIINKSLYYMYYILYFMSIGYLIFCYFQKNLLFPNVSIILLFLILMYGTIAVYYNDDAIYYANKGIFLKGLKEVKQEGKLLKFFYKNEKMPIELITGKENIAISIKELVNNLKGIN